MPKASKIGACARVQLHLADQRRLEALHEAQHVFVQLFVVDPDGFEVVGQLVAQNALHDVEIVMQQQRRLRSALAACPAKCSCCHLRFVHY